MQVDNVNVVVTFPSGFIIFPVITIFVNLILSLVSN
jgi:hypothetical protein